ncbi:MAG: SulP family inorganic anion transporter [Actinomycetota bacterium]
MERIPLLEWLPSYDRTWLRTDVLAGVTVWGVVIPSALAYASIVGVDPIIGVYTVPLALAAYVVFGGARLLVVAPDSAISVMSAAAVGAVIVGDEYLDLTIVLALLSGAIYITFHILRMGWIADLIPDPVLKGFIAGLVWVTILHQIPDLIGIAKPKAEGFFGAFVEVIRALPDADPLTAAIGIGSLTFIIVLKKWVPAVPELVAALAAFIALVAVLDLDGRGLEIVGEVAGGFSGLGIPTGMTIGQVWALVPAAIAIVVLGFTESLGAAKAASEKTQERIDPNQELLAIGLSNVGAGLSSGFVVTGSLSKTAAAEAAGARTQIANLIAAVMGLLTVLFLLPLFKNLALATLAAVVIYVMSHLWDSGYFQTLWRLSRVESAIALVAFFGVLVLGVMPGVVAAVVLSLIAIVMRIGRPESAVLGRTAGGGFDDVMLRDDALEIPGMVIWRQAGPLLFLNARRLTLDLRDAITSAEEPGVVVLDASAITAIDTTGTHEFAAAGRAIKAAGLELWIAGAQERVWERTIVFLEASGEEALPRMETLDQAVSTWQRLSELPPDA